MILLELPPHLDPDVVRPGLGALLLTVGLLVVVGLLAWSMARHMRRIKVPLADESQGAKGGLQKWAEGMRANSPDHNDDDPEDAAASVTKRPPSTAG